MVPPRVELARNPRVFHQLCDGTKISPRTGQFAAVVLGQLRPIARLGEHLANNVQSRMALEFHFRAPNRAVISELFREASGVAPIGDASANPSRPWSGRLLEACA